MRDEITAATRVVVKVGSSSLTTNGRADLDRIAALVDALADWRASGREVVLVSSGAIAAGISPLAMKRRPRNLADQQAAAAVGQGILIQHYAQHFATRDLTVGQVLLTVGDITGQQSYRNALRTLERLLHFGVVPIVNENDTVATDEIRFGDNDRLAALTAHLVHADALVLLSDTDAVYTAHPSDPEARRISEVRDAVADLAGIDTSRGGTSVGTGGMQTKIDAARMATSAGIPALVTSTQLAREALAGEDVGTFFHRTGKRRPARLMWLAHASKARGVLTLDQGAVRALQQRGASLLAAGITAVSGHFQAHDPVELRDPQGRVIGRGLVAYDSDRLPELIGRSTGDLDPQLRRSIVHRDVMVLRPPEARVAPEPAER
ncbi:glutamate 5-kinase [Parenemella sanctibonifatiensis]|uniref:Glutamate 5-kinase n=1 Tax=Parenemella sanctibonifatiensis TaxID=2016505 RepID=A0A255EKH0_9ACTN|nr:glutamate 5-kinase [Parenemella sanctibonifatiensis]OYN92049.1 glutamate 5-kinase [Parenemella sanctibonifatiensis]